MENVSQEISWADAKLYKKADGNEIIAVPVDIKLNSGAKANGSYLLMISKTGNTYKPVTSFNEKKNYFVENIVSAKIKDLYSDAIKPNNKNTVLNNTNKGKVMAVDGAMDCVEWYLTETYYDEEGNVIQYYEHFMYEICQALIDGSSEPTEPPCNASLGAPSSEQISLNKTEEVVGIDTFDVAKPKWKFYNGLTFWFTSTERIAVKVKSGVRSWHSMDHVKVDHVGIWACGDVELLSHKATAHLATASNTDSYVDIDFRLKLQPLNGPSLLLPAENSVARWNINFEKTY